MKEGFKEGRGEKRKTENQMKVGRAEQRGERVVDERVDSVQL